MRSAGGHDARPIRARATDRGKRSPPEARSPPGAGTARVRPTADGGRRGVPIKEPPKGVFRDLPAEMRDQPGCGSRTRIALG